MNPIHATTHSAAGHSPAVFCTTREAADLLGISLRTAQMWVENGLLEGWKTPGGHRRILRSSLDKLLPAQAGAVAGTAAVPPAPTFGAGGTPPAVLVVEDDPHLQRLFRLHLARWQPLPRVFTASDGFEGLLRAGMERPLLIFADLLMPGMDGFRMIGALRSQPELAATRIIVITGLEADDIAAQGHLPPDVEVLRKPIDFTLLQQRWQTLITASTAALTSV
jgi:excisionase family DNA binding protein